MKAKPLLAEAIGTALLVFFGVGAATLSFGFGTAGGSVAAGVVATALTFGLVLLALVYAIGPVSGCHVNPAVTIGFLAARRITPLEAVGYWVAQFIGGIAGAAALYGIARSSPLYHANTGLGANGFDLHSMIGIGPGAAFTLEVILTAVFVFVILAVTRHSVNAAVAGLTIGLTLTLVHLVGIPVDGTSVNPARSLAAALFAGGDALGQVWVFLVAPLIGGLIAAGLDLVLRPAAETPEGGEAAVPAPRAGEAAASSASSAPSAQDDAPQPAPEIRR